MLSILCVRLTIKVKVGIPESYKVGWYPPKKLGRVTLNTVVKCNLVRRALFPGFGGGAPHLQSLGTRLKKMISRKKMLHHGSKMISR